MKSIAFFISILLFVTLQVKAQKHPCPPNSTCPPINDVFVRATVITSTTNWTSATAGFNNIGATSDGQGSTCMATPNQNVWFKFRATTSEIEIKLFTGGANGNIESPSLSLFNSAGMPLKCHLLNASSGVSFIQSIGLVTGEWFYFSVDNKVGGSSGTFTLAVKNAVGFDMKEKATVLSLGTYNSADAAFTTVNATPDQTPGTCAPLSQNVWFKFQAQTAELDFKVRTGGAKGSMINPVVTLYDFAGTVVACNMLPGSFGVAFLQNIGLSVGATYYISIDNGASGSPGTFSVSASNQVGFDMFEKAVTISQSTYVSTNSQYTTVDATPDKTSGNCTGVNQNVWFKFHATTTEAEIKVTTGGLKGTLTFPVVTLYNSIGTPLKCFALNAAGGTAFIQTVTLFTGYDYYFSVDRGATGAAGSFSLSFTNNIGYDMKEKAAVISQPSWSSSAAGLTNDGATPDATAGNCTVTRNNVWFTFQAAEEEIEIKVFTGGSKGTISKPVITLYGANNQAIQCYTLTSSNGIAYIQNTSLTKGSTYYFSIDNDASGATGTYTLTITNSIGYDLRERAQTLNTNSVSSSDAAFSTVAATADGPSNICAANAQNVWFKFFAPTNQTTVSVSTGDGKGSLTYPVITLSDASGNTLSCKSLGSATGTAQLDYTQLVIGQWYYLSIDHDEHGTEGTFTLNFTNGVTQVISEFAFEYKYDVRKRMIAKKVPGAEWVYMVYDDRDRLTMTQDGEQRKNNEWTYTKYDVLNRPVITGIYKHGSTVDQATMTANVAQEPLFETFDKQQPNGYTSNVFSGQNFSGGTFDVLTVSYYDNYEFLDLVNNNEFNYKANDITDCVQKNGNNYCQEAAPFARVTNQVTGTCVKVLGTQDYLWQATYYDSRYRVIQTIASNYKGGYDRSTNVVDFNGKVLLSRLQHVAAQKNPMTIARKFEYDHVTRLTKAWHSINGTDPVVLLSNEYNELGQLVDKKLYSTDGQNFEQSIDYRYNIRGWMTSINNALLSNDGSTNDEVNDLFGMNLSYDKVLPSVTTAGDVQFNGNISAIQYSANMGLDNTKQTAYKFGYDPMNRLKSATYFKNLNGPWVLDASYSENIPEYDLNGNIKKLNRTGTLGSDMDHLTYTYKGNQLLKVVDTGLADQGFKEGTNTGDDFEYNDNGAMKLDRNKDISSISYNHLNLPRFVTKATGEKLQYIYDATGRKLRQIVFKASGETDKTTDYEGAFHYEQDVLQFINHEEGRVVMTGSEPEYQFFMKDHLGNVRMTFTTKDEVETSKAGYEPQQAADERAKYLYYDKARLIHHPVYDHTYDGQPTPGDGAYAQRLSGGEFEKIGLARSLSVMPGDKVHFEVYAKYFDPNGNNDPNFALLMAAVISGLNIPPGTIVDGSSYGQSPVTSVPYGDALEKGVDNGNGPRAYLNWLVFDRDFNPDLSKSGFKRVSANARENGDNVPHELLSPDQDITITKAGYVYIWLSNEEATPVEVYFDDFKVEQTKSSVVQMEEYYPFGLSFNDYSRENTTPNEYLYNGKEKQDEFDLGWLDYGQRMYQPELGRFNTIDIRAHNYMAYSLYGYAANNPINNIDYYGEFILPKEFIERFKRITQYLKNDIQGILSNKRIVRGLKKFGGFSDAQLKEAFTWGKGPVLHPTEFNDEEKFTRFGDTMGLLDGEGNYLPGSASTAINIDLFKELESATGKDRDYWLFMTAVTILHELVHVGELENNFDNGAKEGGNAFEKHVYGQVINTRTGSYKSVLDNWMKRTGQPPLDYFYNNGSNSNDSQKQKQKQKKKPNADREAAKRSGGAY